MDLTDQQVLVVGAGKSGLSAARFLINQGAGVTLTDRQLPAGLNPHPKMQLVGEAHLRVEPGSFDLVIASPGVPLDAPVLAAAKKARLPVWGELELAYRFARSPLVAITGTNGKTTTTALLGEIFSAAGYRTLVGGNIGLPLVDQVEQYGPQDLIVAEVSSFQLETVDLFQPAVAVITNITPDHLDRHGDLKHYAAAKARIFARQGPREYTVLNYDDPRVRSMAASTRGGVIFFSRRHTLDQGVFVREGELVALIGEQECSIAPAASLALPGPHNLENALAAAAAAMVLGVPAAILAAALQSFAGVVHRLELVAEIDGVKYINDSKGTNPEASMKALASFEQPIILLAGGRNKGNDFSALAREIRERVRLLVVLGECAAEMETAARQAGCSAIVRAADLSAAVQLARERARPGEVVLLSPACASWDMFANYEERGDEFRAMVRRFQQ